MTDRTSLIAGTPAAAAFPQLAAFLAEHTTLAPEVAEAALRAAAGDYIVAEQAIDTNAAWKRATAAANASFGVPSDQVAAASEGRPVHPTWGAAIATANARNGL